MAHLEQLAEWRDRLKQDGYFTRPYSSVAPRASLGARRSRIRQGLLSLSLYGDRGYACTVEDAEQLRRYFDAYFDIAPLPNDCTLHKYDYLTYALDPEPAAKKGNRIMDHNLAALLRSDAKTVHVRLVGADSTATKTYTYVTHLALEKDDWVVIDTRGFYTCGVVVRMDNEAKIEPGCDTEYKWVIAKIDMAAHVANEARNTEIVAEAAVIVRENMRRSFAQQVLGAASGEQRDKLLRLTGNATA
jgi:hypothetical protein